MGFVHSPDIGLDIIREDDGILLSDQLVIVLELFSVDVRGDFSLSEKSLALDKNSLLVSFTVAFINKP
jgi:hypothetical protein